MRLRHPRLRIDGVDESVDELTHAILAQVLPGCEEVRAVPVASPVPPAPVAMVGVPAHLAHEVGGAEHLPVSGLVVGVAPDPPVRAPVGALHPVTQHPDPWEPRLPGVVPHAAVLPLQDLLAHVIQIGSEDPHEVPGGADRFTGRELACIAGQRHIQTRPAALFGRADLGPPVGHAVEPHVGRGLAAGETKPWRVRHRPESEASPRRTALPGVGEGSRDGHAARRRRYEGADRRALRIGVHLGLGDERLHHIHIQPPSLAIPTRDIGIGQVAVLAIIAEIAVVPAAVTLDRGEALRSAVGGAIIVGDDRIPLRRVACHLLMPGQNEGDLVALGDLQGHLVPLHI